jgi:hypothetical protein
VGVTSTSGASPTVAENLTFGVLPIRTSDDDVRADRSLCEIAQF